MKHTIICIYYLSLNNNVINIIYLQINYNLKKLIKNSRKKIFINIYKINFNLAYFFRIFFVKSRPKIKNIYKHKVSSLFIFLLGLNIAVERGQIFKVKFIDFIYNFYKQVINYVY